MTAAWALWASLWAVFLVAGLAPVFLVLARPRRKPAPAPHGAATLEEVLREAFFRDEITAQSFDALIGRAMVAGVMDRVTSRGLDGALAALDGEGEWRQVNPEHAAVAMLRNDRGEIRYVRRSA